MPQNTRRRRPHHHRPGWERGGASSVEVLLLAPVVMLLIMVVVAGGRVAIVETSIEGAARSAARAAALESGPVPARAAAVAVAGATLEGRSVECSHRDVSVDVSGFHRAPGLPADVSVTVTCTVPLTDLYLVPGLEDGRIISRTVSVPLDTYRERP